VPLQRGLGRYSELPKTRLASTVAALFIWTEHPRLGPKGRRFDSHLRPGDLATFHPGSAATRRSCWRPQPLCAAEKCSACTWRSKPTFEPHQPGNRIDSPAEPVRLDVEPLVRHLLAATLATFLLAVPVPRLLSIGRAVGLLGAPRPTARTAGRPLAVARYRPRRPVLAAGIVPKALPCCGLSLLFCNRDGKAEGAGDVARRRGHARGAHDWRDGCQQPLHILGR
jgi:hypothetical protein